MCINQLKAIFEFIKFQIYKSLPETEAVFKAFVNMQIPKTYVNDNNKGREKINGALISNIYKYQIWSLNYQSSFVFLKINFRVNLANATAKMLDVVAEQLISSGCNKKPVKPNRKKEMGAFVSLHPTDRYRALNLLEQLKIDRSKLPIPFRNSPDFIFSVLDAIYLLTTLGYYFEWSGYGNTRTKMPSKRRLQYLPISWKQIGYPGPSKGYRALRNPLLKK